MPDVEFTNLLAVTVIALLAPLLLGLAPALRLPAVVLEIIAGVVVGPQGLGWVEVDLPVSIVALLGLAFLLFLAGLEIDVHRLRGQVLRLALLGYVVTLALGLCVGVGFDAAGWVQQPRPGRRHPVCDVARAGRAGPQGRRPDRQRARPDRRRRRLGRRLRRDRAALAALLHLGRRAPVAAWCCSARSRPWSRPPRPWSAYVAGSRRLELTLTRLQDTTAQIRVRAAVVLLVAFVALAEQFGLESILGAFMAGAVVGLVDRDSASHPNFRVKLEAIGYGFLIPVFFVTSGLRLDLSGLLENPSALARVPVFAVALLLVRGLPALLFGRLFDRRAVLAAGLLQATSLPFIVTATQIGVLTGLMDGSPPRPWSAPDCCR